MTRRLPVVRMPVALVPAPRVPAVARLDGGAPWRRVVEAYLAAAIDSEHTRRAYRRHLVAARSHLGISTLAELSGEALAAHRAELLRDGRGTASHAQHLAALRAFLRWSGTFQAHGLRFEVIREALRTPSGQVRRPYHVLRDAEAAALLEAAATPRDRALVGVFLGAGLRAGELAALAVADVLEDSEGGAALYVRQGKGRKDRIVPILGDVLALVRRYLASSGRTLGEPGPLFRSHDRGAPRRARRGLTARAVAYVVAKATRAAHITAKRVSPHSLRHTYALRTLRHSKNLVAVKNLLGHASIQTTQKYLDHLELGELREAVMALPRGSSSAEPAGA